MVYLRKIIEENKARIAQHKNIELVAYLFISSPNLIKTYTYDLTPDEEVAFKGYQNSPVNIETIKGVINKPPIKGINALSNIYKLSGLYLSAKSELVEIYQKKFDESDLKQMYFICKIEPSFNSLLEKKIENNTSPISKIINVLLGKKIAENDLNNALTEIVRLNIDSQTLIILEDLEKSLLELKYINLDSNDLINHILNNFSNSIQKITKNRRKHHTNFSLNDEYDVQDILYVILKSVFPNLRDEDPIPKVGAKSTKIDLILRDENILIEVKMLKESDPNETQFIEQLKIDIESYHQCAWLDKLFCFVYDPHRKTRDVSNFYDLNGTREKNGHKFDVEVIVVN